ncbi:MAG: NitT/TauT family transport system permease protein [Halanaerobium sp. 4-GBenrich]|jgi:NitT/TauT family transport system permease protein|uniref:NitT/TauT family transport system permease protein n=1 Tax=Halanaerobium congolense TaxID=54121 RepID=A0A1G6NS46_9FIRM|nr:ABC transporter permease subunit [Halanaerobium congolense]KXS47720.1 MAG: NitT/TauT family transport system permease protein [Halanaerobium sp. T82-1]ODS50277.1 MAG: NitT/TauT family transport system permease protein [Halanaerobium sp. 4-GBenrich]PUU90031.1 MAG: NitT/TauT family transport system permease protein [Halanaerobium sp.]PTX17857.1 NitT/TauT family transport system permease protein [Halanaerobium congolense]PXV63472.1 NitT/TauT family transport system permease protein [Halanaerob
MENKYRQRLVWVTVLALFWQLTAWSGLFSDLIFPGLDQIFLALLKSLKDGTLVKQIAFSLSIIIQGLIIAAAAALILALTAYFSKYADGLIDTLTALAHPLPGIALMPLILIWFGSGKTAILIVIIHSVLWPLILNLSTGFNSIPDIYTLIAKNYRLNKLEFMFKILIPASFPYFISGLKIAWARSWRALISAEMLFGAINSLGGLGWYIFQKRVFFDLPGVFAGIIVIIFIGVTVEDFIFKKLETNTVRKWGMLK